MGIAFGSLSLSCSRTCFQVPRNSCSGEILLHLHQTAFQTQSVFTKYVVVPSLALAFLPIFAYVDICGRFACWQDRKWNPEKYQGFQPETFSDCLQDIASHVMSVVFLPFKLIAYVAKGNPSLFAVRQASRDPYHLVFQIISSNLSSQFIEKVVRDIPVSDEDFRQFDPHFRLYYQLVKNYSQVELVKRVLLSKTPEEIFDSEKELFRFIFKSEDPELVVPLERCEARLAACLEVLRLNQESRFLSDPSREKYWEQAKKFLGFVSRIHRPYFPFLRKWFSDAIAIDHVDIIKAVLDYCSLKEFAPHLNTIVSKILEEKRDYAPQLKALLRLQGFNSDLCAEIYDQWYDKEQSLNDHELIGLLFEQGYVNSRRPRTENMLFAALKYRNYPLLEKIWSTSASTDFSYFVDNPLYWAMKVPDSSLRKRLAKVICEKRPKEELNRYFSGLDPLLEGHTPLTYAASQGDVDLLEILVPHVEKERPSSHKDYSRKTALEIAQETWGGSRAADFLKSGRKKPSWTQKFEEFFFGKSSAGTEEKKEAPPPKTPPRPTGTTYIPCPYLSDSLTRLIDQALAIKPNTPRFKKLQEWFELAKVEKNPWRVLGVKGGALDEENFNKVFKKLSKAVHPDKNREEPKELPTAAMAVLNEVKQELTALMQKNKSSVAKNNDPGKALNEDIRKIIEEALAVQTSDVALKKIQDLLRDAQGNMNLWILFRSYIPLSEQELQNEFSALVRQIDPNQYWIQRNSATLILNAVVAIKEHLSN